jgi:hypothetical protein
VASLADLPINSCELDIPFRGTWLARVTLTDAQGPAEGDLVTLAIGPLTLIGTVIGAGQHGGVATARVVGGYGGWRQAPTGLSFQNDANLSKKDLASSLASAVGESITSDVTTIGANWCFDPLASAGSNLDLLGEWYMGNDGVTVLGTRPDLAEFKTTVSEFEGLEGRAVCEVEEYQADKFLPGALISAASLENSIRVKHARFLYTPKKFTIEVSSVEQLPNRLAEHAARKSRFFGTYLYRIIEQISDRLNLQAVDPVRGIPDQVLVDKTHGFPGALSDCNGSGECLVVFANGDVSRPYVTAYLGTATAVYMTSRTVDQNVMLAPALCQLLGSGGGAQAIVALLAIINVAAPGTFTPVQIAQAVAAAAKFAIPNQPGVQTQALRAPPIA